MDMVFKIMSRGNAIFQHLKDSILLGLVPAISDGTEWGLNKDIFFVFLKFIFVLYICLVYLVMIL